MPCAQREGPGAPYAALRREPEQESPQRLRIVEAWLLPQHRHHGNSLSRRPPKGQGDTERHTKEKRCPIGWSMRNRPSQFQPLLQNGNSHVRENRSLRHRSAREASALETLLPAGDYPEEQPGKGRGLDT